MSDPKADEFDKDYWFEMYQGQCATTDEWAKKYREEIERKADATLLARCDELQRIAEVANAMVGKSRDQIETQAKRIAELDAHANELAATCQARDETIHKHWCRVTELEADNARLRVDAERWNDSVANGFPRFAQPVATSHAGHWWCVRNGIGYQGMTPAAAIDAAKEQS